MNRTEVIQQVIDTTEAQTYLEIGVASGANFSPIRARRKIAVDPALPRRPRRPMHGRVASVLKGLRDGRSNSTRYFKCTSDEFFRRNPRLRLDVVFIDGLHTYDQSLKDVINSLNLLNERGVIILHDCSPPSESAAHPGTSPQQVAALDLPGWTGDWCGDVWKTICHLRSQRRDLTVFVLDCDYGVGIVTRGKPADHLDLSEDALTRMTYEGLAEDRRNLLGLKRQDYLQEFLAGV